MKNIVLIFLISFTTSLLAQVRVIGVKDCSNSETLSFATVYNQTRVSESGVTDLKGLFLMQPSGKSDVNTIYRISHVGYEDHILTVKQEESIGDTVEVCLKKQPQVLEEVAVLSRDWKINSLGMDKVQISEKDLQNSSGWPFKELGYHNGIYLRNRKLKNAILEEINFLVAGEVNQPEFFLIRILVPKTKVQGNRMLASNDFYDYLKEPLLHQIKHSGWQTVTINQLTRLPDQDFLLFIVRLESKNPSGEILIPFANSFGKLDKNVFWAYQVSSGYSVNMQKDTKEFVPAIGIKYAYK